jgi:carboxylesterase type B
VGLAFVPSIEKVLQRTNDTDPEHDLPFLTEHPLTLLKEGRFNRVPILMGFNANEAMLFIRRKILFSPLLIIIVGMRLAYSISVNFIEKYS